MDKRKVTSKVNGKLGGRPSELSTFKVVKNENWRSIKGFPQYMVSDHGRIMSLKSGKPKLLKLSPDKDGYPRVNLNKGGKGHPRKVHRLVLQTFLGDPPSGHEASHNNHEKDDNSLENLSWETHKENIRRNIDRGVGCIGLLGEENHACKYTYKQVGLIKYLDDNTTTTHQEISDKLKIPRRHVSKILRGDMRVVA